MNYLSLFSGVESATVAWQPLGWQPVAFSEIEPFCNAVLAQNIPDVANLGDITHIKEEALSELAPFDLVVFGSPCQDLSVAGKRAGLSGEKSRLFREAIRLVRYARQYCGCRFVLWENVPGVFSSQKGQDFAEVLRLFTGSRQRVPDKGWKTSGVAWGPDALVEWRVLDAQHFGVPQRRRRVFLVADFGDWAGRSPVLFEHKSLSGHPETRRASPQDLAGTLESRTSAGGFPGTDGACANHVIPIHDQATRYAGKRADNQDGKGNGFGIGQPGDPMNTLTSGDQHALFCASFKIGQGSAAGNIGYSPLHSPTLTHSDSGTQLSPGLIRNQEVRRLTPLECERLQGLPDNWTRISWKGREPEECPVTPRYKAIGNSMAVPVMHWIGQRLEQELQHAE